MIPFKGTVKRIIYSSKSMDSFCILALDDDSREVKVKGYLPCVHDGFYLTGSGDIQKDDYGDTVIIKKVEVRLPNDLNKISGYFTTLLGYKEKPFSVDSDNDYEEKETNDDQIYSHSTVSTKTCQNMPICVIDKRT